MSGIIKFVKRGGASALSIDQDDLAATDSVEAIVDVLTISRQQESELPQQISIGYTNYLADYQQGVQFSARMSVNSINKVQVSLPCAISDDYAKALADSHMYSLWQKRNTFTLQISNKYKYLEPTDIIDVVTDTATHRLLITKIDDSLTGILSLECVSEDSSVYDFTGTGGVAPVQDQTIYGLTKTRIQYIDYNLLRDQDDGCGMYVAADGYDAGWKGTVIHKSDDNGQSYIFLASVLNETYFGNTASVLGDGRCDIFDEGNYVDVNFPYGGEPTSTNALAVLAGANAALIGSEIIQYKNAEYIDGTTYRLSGLLRGRRGTEWATSTHTGAELAVLLSLNMRKISLPTADIGTTKPYKAVTVNDSLTATIARSITFSNVGAKPYAPIHIEGRDTYSGNARLWWTRQTRIGGEWRDKVDASIGETSELYDVEILTPSGNVVRTVTDTANSYYSYSSSELTTDFGVTYAELVASGVVDYSTIIYDAVRLGDVVYFASGNLNAGVFGVNTVTGAITQIFAGTDVAEGPKFSYALEVYNGSLYVACGNAVGDACVYKWDGASTWTKIAGGGTNSSWADGTKTSVRSLTSDGSYLYMGTSGAAGDAEVWTWNDTTCVKIGGDAVNSSWADTTFEIVASLAFDGTKLVAGLGSSTGDGEVWSWDSGAFAWTKIGGDGVNSSWNTNYEIVRSLYNDGTYLYAGLGNTAGDAEVWRWGGASWTKIGGDAVNSSWSTNYEEVYSMTGLNGKLYVGLGTGTGDGEVWMWNGSTWVKEYGDGLWESWATTTTVIVFGDSTTNNLFMGLGTDGAVYATEKTTDPIPKSINFRVYQKSSVFGRGYTGYGVLTRF